MIGDNQANNVLRSSPIQIPGTNWATTTGSGRRLRFATKTDGTLWGWGYNGEGDLGVNDKTDRSSPTQIPGTTWKDIAPNAPGAIAAIKTDGTLWSWGNNDYGQQGNNTSGNPALKSSPVQVGSETTWHNISGGAQNFIAITQE
jgi:alpha-tubulin suppressor-like RCC1 family protein